MQLYNKSYCRKLFTKINELSEKIYILDELPSSLFIENGVVLARKLRRGKKQYPSVKIPY